MPPSPVKTLILVQKGTHEPWLGDLQQALDGFADVRVLDATRGFASQLDDVRVVIDLIGHPNRETIDAGAAAGVEFWQVFGVGVDHVDVDYILDRGIRLTNTPGPFSAIALAEHAMFLMLSLAKNYLQARRNLHSGVMCLPVCEELAGRTLGLVGFGASARELAVRGRAFGMRIVAIDVVEPTAEELAAIDVSWFGSSSDLPQLLRESDFVSLHVPLTAGTHHMLDAELLALMKPTAVLINVARGAIVDEDALVRALRNGNLRGAGIDAYSVEPPALDHPLLTLENVVATPHIAGVTYGTSKRRSAACAENVRRIGEGLAPLYEVTRQADSA